MTDLPVVDLVRRDTIRLVNSGRLKAPALAPLAADASALATLQALEGVTSERLRAERGGLTALDPRELVFGRPGYSFVNAAFAYTRPGGNRFNDDARGAWYAAFTARAALAEVTWHLTRELVAIDRFDTSSDFAELRADFIGPFHDLRGVRTPSHRALDPDPTIGYPAGQTLARALRADGSNGIVYPSVRASRGTCLVAFRPDLVQHVRQGGIWRLRWSGSATPTVSRLRQRPAA
jgi:hypothetical protein